MTETPYTGALLGYLMVGDRVVFDSVFFSSVLRPGDLGTLVGGCFVEGVLRAKVRWDRCGVVMRHDLSVLDLAPMLPLIEAGRYAKWEDLRRWEEAGF